MRSGFAFTMLCALGFAATVHAADLTAIKPGLMCVSASALAELTLPNGDSRTHLQDASSSDQLIAQQGGCVDIALSSKVTVLQRRKNTSIVRFPAGASNSTIYIVPNIDFNQPADLASSEAAPETNAAAGAPLLPMSGSGMSVDQAFNEPTLNGAIAGLAFDKLTGITPDFDAYAKASQEYQTADVFQQAQILPRLEAGYEAQFNALNLNQIYTLRIEELNLSQFDPARHGFPLDFDASDTVVLRDPVLTSDTYNIAFDNTDQFNFIPFSDTNAAENFASKYDLSVQGLDAATNTVLQVAFRLESAPPAISTAQNVIMAHILAARIWFWNNPVPYVFPPDPQLNENGPAGTTAMAPSVPVLKDATIQQIFVGMPRQAAIAAAEQRYPTAQNDVESDRAVYYEDPAQSTVPVICNVIQAMNVNPGSPSGTSAEKCLAFMFSGGKVNKVASEQRVSGTTLSALTADLIAKYGKPTYTNLSDHNEWIGSDGAGQIIDINSNIETIGQYLVLSISAAPWTNPRATSALPTATGPNL